MNTPMPNVFLIGAPKCGTTALASYLSERNDVFLSYPKEPSYWSHDFKQGSGVAQITSQAAYDALYAEAGGYAVRLDASTSYLMSDVAIPAILKAVPNAKFLIMLRDPVEMVQAWHMEKCFNLSEDEDSFQCAWELWEDRQAGVVPWPKGAFEPRELNYRAVAALGSQLERAFGWIPETQRLVLFQDDLAQNPNALWAQVLHFLDLPEDGRTEFPVVGGAHFNRSKTLAKLYQAPPPVLAPLIQTLKKMTRTGLGSKALEAVKGLLISRGKRAVLETDFQSRLRETFAPEIAKINTLTGRNLWSDTKEAQR